MEVKWMMISLIENINYKKILFLQKKARGSFKPSLLGNLGQNFLKIIST